jgi:antitoxin component YwqK of YwqJK toxin-antitoxin module
MFRKTIYIFIALAWVSCASTFALEADTLNRSDNNSQRVGYWVITNAEKQNEDCDESAKLEEGRYVNNMKSGTWKFYNCRTGNIKSEITFKEDKKIGYAKIYGSNGKLREEGFWNTNHWEGKYKFYHENGNLYQDFQFGNDGKRDGPQRYYHSNGKLMVEGNWKDSKEAGIIKSYNEDGQLIEEKNFRDGELDPESVKTYTPEKPQPAVEKEPEKTPPPVEEKASKVSAPGQIPDGFHKTYDSNGRLLREGEFKNGMLTQGKIYVYENNKLVKTNIIVNGSVEKTLYEKK